MRLTPYSSPSDKEIDALLTPPACSQCSEPVESYDELCEHCEEQNLIEHHADINFDDLKHPI